MLLLLLLLLARMQNVEHFKQRENFALLLLLALHKLPPSKVGLHFLISDWLWGNDRAGSDMGKSVVGVEYPHHGDFSGFRFC